MSRNALLTGKPNMSLIDALSAHIAVTDQNGLIIATNHAWDQFALKNGITKYQSYGVGSNYFDTCLNAAKNGDEYALKALLGLKDVLRGKKKEFALEYPCHSQDEHRWFLMRGSRLNDPENGLIIAHENTTAQRIAEYKLRENEEKYRLQFENSLECVVIATPEGKILDANPMALQTLGYTLEELQAIGRDGLIDPNDSRIHNLLEQREKYGQFRGELNYRRSDGNVLAVSLSTKIYENGSGEKRSIVMFRDITKQKLVEKKLGQEKSLSKAILDNLPGTFCMINQDGYAVQWNKNLENVIGYSPDEIRSRPTQNFICKNDQPKLVSALDEVFHRGESMAELGLLTKDGRTIPFFFVGVRFMLDEQPYLIALGVNLEEQAALENELNMNRALFTQLFDNSPIGIALISESLEINMTNKGFANSFGYTENEVLGKDLVNLIVPEELRDEVRRNAPMAFTEINYHA
ncbi:MAG TPA: PAS domain S-box protein, partial [Balneolales bacterium]|nr:PAS domain S-box protein [Balneolales bacterium]